jgi:hypothetical protein
LRGVDAEQCKPTLAGPAHVVSAGLDACGSKTAAITVSEHPPRPIELTYCQERLRKL